MPLTAIITLWTAGKGLQGLTNGLNSVYQVYETRNYFAARIRSALYTLIFIVLIVATLILLVFGNSIQGALVEHLPFISGVTESILQMRTALSLVVLSTVFLMMYKFLPNRKATLKSQLPGAVISAVAWSVFSCVFPFIWIFQRGQYVRKPDDPDHDHAVDVFLHVYLLLGAEINAYFEDRFRRLQQAAMEHLRMEMRSFAGGEEEEQREKREEKKEK